VVKIEDFEITFLLDAHPIASEIVTEDVSAPVAAGAGAGCNMTMIDEDLPTGFPSVDPGAGRSPGAGRGGDGRRGELFGPKRPRRRSSPRSSRCRRCGRGRARQAPVASEEILAFEPRVRVEDLPEPLRAALGEVEGKLRLPVEIVLKSDL
jgi:hypothetical protein